MNKSRKPFELTMQMWTDIRYLHSTIEADCLAG